MRTSMSTRSGSYSSTRRTASAPSAASPTISRSLLGLEDHAEALAQQRLVVGQHDADRHGAAGALQSRSVAATSQPPAARGPATSVPPNAVARSVIPATPCPPRGPRRAAPVAVRLPVPVAVVARAAGTGTATSVRPSSVTRTETSGSRELQPHLHRGRLVRVLQGVGQRLLHDAVDGQAGGAGDGEGPAGALQGDVEPRAPDALDERMRGRRGPAGATTAGRSPPAAARRHPPARRAARRACAACRSAPGAPCSRPRAAPRRPAPGSRPAAARRRRPGSPSPGCCARPRRASPARCGPARPPPPATPAGRARARGARPARPASRAGCAAPARPRRPASAAKASPVRKTRDLKLLPVGVQRTVAMTTPVSRMTARREDEDPFGLDGDRVDGDEERRVRQRRPGHEPLDEGDHRDGEEDGHGRPAPEDQREDQGGHEPQARAVWPPASMNQPEHSTNSTTAMATSTAVA